jgi:hypothetical protein
MKECTRMHFCGAILTQPVTQIEFYPNHWQNNLDCWQQNLVVANKQHLCDRLRQMVDPVQVMPKHEKLNYKKTTIGFFLF